MLGNHPLYPAVCDDQGPHVSVKVEGDIPPQYCGHQMADEAGAKGAHIVLHALTNELAVPVLRLCPSAPSGNLFKRRAVGDRRRGSQVLMPFAQRFGLKGPDLQIAAFAQGTVGHTLKIIGKTGDHVERNTHVVAEKLECLGGCLDVGSEVAFHFMTGSQVVEISIGGFLGIFDP